MRKNTRIIKFLIFIIIIIIGSFGYYHARYIAPNDYKIKRTTINNKQLPKEFEDFEIAFISDINLKNTNDLDRLDNIISTLNKQQVEMVIFGGDLFDSNPFDNDEVINLLSKIKSSYGKFAVLGEKDLASLNDVSVILNEGGFEILHNEYRPIYYNNAVIGLFGLESSGNVAGLINENNQDVYKLVAVHEPDYFDETVMEEYEELWRDFPNYKIRSNSDLLPLFIDKPMMYPRGSKFQYNNTGFVVLAMIIEALTQKPFDEYLNENIFKPCQMTSTGYYELDRLPAKCAFNYIYDDKRNEYRTNIFSVDAKGTGAGGAFTTVHDIKLFWDNLLSYKLLSAQMTENMLSNHTGEQDYYGYGLWLKKNDTGFHPYFQGCDPGVSFISSYNLEKKLMIVLVSNYGDNVWKLLNNITKHCLEL